MIRPCAAFTFFVASLCFLGCSDGKPKPVPVKGKVTLDSKPLASGKIAFDATDGTAPVTLDVKDGAYQGEVVPGPKTVRITSFKLVKMPNPTGMTGPGYENQQIEDNFLPARYNTASKEVRDVKTGEPNEFDFAVTTK